MLISNKCLPVSVIVATRNEVVNIDRCLEALKPASRILVVDSGSTDGTVEKAQSYDAEVYTFNYKGGYPKKRQWAMDALSIDTEWIMFVDADEVIPEALWQEIRHEISTPDSCDGYLITKGFHFMGKRFRHGGFSHAAILLIRQGKAHFESLDEDVTTIHDMEVHERIIVDGCVGKIKTALVHEDFKGLTAYIDRHNQYSTWEAGVRFKYLKYGEYGKDVIQSKLFGNVQERRRYLKLIAVRIPFEAVMWFIYHYFFRLGFLEGLPGYIASMIRAQYISQVRMKIHELRLKADDDVSH